MPISSNHNGRAFEFITLKQFEREISKFRSVLIDEGGGYAASAKSSEKITKELRLKLEKSAEIAVEIVLSLEPLILIQSTDMIVLKILTDEAGKQGDVRDIVIEQPDIEWVIGLSLKHNHKAVKHSRLSKGLDFGKMWYKIPCSQNYWNNIKPVFDKLEILAHKKTEWKSIKDKGDIVYLPLLNAFMDEIMRAKARHPKKVARFMTLYLLGIHDYYKVQTIDAKRIVNLKAFNLHGTLGIYDVENKQSKIQILPLPDRIIHLGIKPGSKTTVEMCLNHGWSFAFRIHNASSKVESSLKFDVSLIGHPNEIVNITKCWK